MLTPTVFSDEFESFMNRYISLSIPDSDDPEFEPTIDQFSVIFDDDGNIVSPVGDFPLEYSLAYEKYSLTGEVLGALHGVQEPEIIETFLRSFSTSVTEFATALADYWSTILIVPGAPAHGGDSVSSVVNDAANQVPAFEEAILASITTEYKYPVMVHLIENIESIALPQVTWTVTELFDGSPVSFPEQVF